MLAIGLTTIGDLQHCDPHRLEEELGRHAADGFLRLAYGIDERSITLESEDKSISNETTFKEDTTDQDFIEAAYKRLIDKVGSRLRKAGLFGTTLHLKIRWSDFSTITRQTRCSIPCCDDITLREIGLSLFRAHLRNRPIRLIGFGVSGLCSSDRPQTDQLPLFESDEDKLRQKRNRLSHTADAIKQRFGNESIRRASAIEDNKEP